MVCSSLCAISLTHPTVPLGQGTPQPAASGSATPVTMQSQHSLLLRRGLMTLRCTLMLALGYADGLREAWRNVIEVRGDAHRCVTLSVLIPHWKPAAVVVCRSCFGCTLSARSLKRLLTWMISAPQTAASCPHWASGFGTATTHGQQLVAPSPLGSVLPSPVVAGCPASRPFFGRKTSRKAH